MKLTKYKRTNRQKRALARNLSWLASWEADRIRNAVEFSASCGERVISRTREEIRVLQEKLNIS